MILANNHGRNRALLTSLVFAVAVFSVLLAFPIASSLPAQRVVIIYTNMTNDDIAVRVHVDMIQESRVVPSNGMTVFVYHVTGCVHRYFAIAHSTSMLIDYFVDWHYAFIPPYGQLTIVL